MSGVVDSQWEILKRICARGRTYFLEKEDSVGVDLFEHIEQEIERTKLYLERYE